MTVHALLAQDFTAPSVEWWHISPVIALVAGALRRGATVTVYARKA